MEADESYFVLNPAADWQPVEIVKMVNLLHVLSEEQTVPDIQ